MDPLESLTEFVTSRFARERGAPIDPEDDLLRQGILDSIAIMHIVDHIEQDLGIDLEGDEITVENFQSLASITRLIERKRGGAAPA